MKPEEQPPRRQRAKIGVFSDPNLVSLCLGGSFDELFVIALDHLLVIALGRRALLLHGFEEVLAESFRSPILISTWNPDRLVVGGAFLCLASGTTCPVS